MKKFRKVIVALLAMTMALGMFATVASAAPEKTYYVVGTMNGWDCANAIEMTDEGNGIWTYTFDAEEVAEPGFKIVTVQGDWNTQISMGGGNNGGNFTYECGGKVKITLDTAKIGAENAGDDAVTAAAVTDTATGVAAPVVVAAIAVVSMVGIVVFAKRRTVAE